MYRQKNRKRQVNIVYSILISAGMKFRKKYIPVWYTGPFRAPGETFYNWESLKDRPSVEMHK
jgi:hypothetical protein